MGTKKQSAQPTTPTAASSNSRACPTWSVSDPRIAVIPYKKGLFCAELTGVVLRNKNGRAQTFRTRAAAAQYALAELALAGDCGPPDVPPAESAPDNKQSTERLTRKALTAASERLATYLLEEEEVTQKGSRAFSSALYIESVKALAAASTALQALGEEQTDDPSFKDISSP